MSRFQVKEYRSRLMSRLMRKTHEVEKPCPKVECHKASLSPRYSAKSTKRVKTCTSMEANQGRSKQKLDFGIPILNESCISIKNHQFEVCTSTSPWKDYEDGDMANSFACYAIPKICDLNKSAFKEPIKLDTERKRKTIIIKTKDTKWERLDTKNEEDFMISSTGVSEVKIEMKTHEEISKILTRKTFLRKSKCPLSLMELPSDIGKSERNAYKEEPKKTSQTLSFYRKMAPKSQKAISQHNLNLMLIKRKLSSDSAMSERIVKGKVFDLNDILNVSNGKISRRHL
ncbi:unnamed protein product [Blepharisma stoltei]|uniref:Uncharacterized protein n=1 Tax=Blepharisma stoltei TaxID=1481888 RepID=A0AAU9JAQ7_9CILI|nr:unnamed protein product [Blepharisma stoltei]